MSNWLRDPVLDDGARVGLSFITIGYGVVLVAVFPMAPLGRIGVAGWFHLALAAFMLIVSYIGYYNNRQKYAAWKVNFFNIPLLQYVVSFVILFLYWELGSTAPKQDSHSALTFEAVIVLVVFVAYLTWDCLEVAVQESSRYIQKLIDTDHYDLLPPLAQDYTQRPGRRLIRTRTRWFAKDARAGRTMTLAYAVLCAAGLMLVVFYRVRGTTATAAVDSVYIVGLFAYRYCQWKWSTFWYHAIGTGRPSPSAARTRA
jgi:hypothetical protein